MTAFAMTETEAGSDVAAIATTARREGSGYVVDRSQDADLQRRHRRSLRRVRLHRPGQGRQGDQLLSGAGQHARSQVHACPGPERPASAGGDRLDNCRVPADALLGAEGRGYGLGLAALDRLRPTVAAAACGMAARALAEALAHVKQRRQFGTPLAQFQLVQQKLARMATDLTAARLLTYRAAYEKDQGQERITSEAAMAKSFATEMAQRAVDDAVQLVGGRGVLASHPVERLYRAVRALRIYEGTTEIQQLIIAGELLK